MANRRIARRRAGRGFTMIEIMIVVGIIIILAGIGIAVGLQVKRSSADQSTRATMEALRGAMGLYLKEHAEPSDGRTAWFQALQSYPSTKVLLDNMKLHYTSPQPNSGVAPVPDGVYDGYGNQIEYRRSKAATATSPAQTNGYFVSGGPDGNIGLVNGVNYGADDIFSDGVSAQ